MLGETKLLSKRFSSVLPIKRQPPEDSTGYMPVCLSAIPTDPAGPSSWGVQLKIAQDSSNAPKLST